MHLGVEAVTVYAFSLENFKRSKDEVDYLMQLFCEAFEGFCVKG
jgi:ditrans,polycis-polyprenyl diphosphate synthase